MFARERNEVAASLEWNEPRYRNRDTVQPLECWKYGGAAPTYNIRQTPLFDEKRGSGSNGPENDAKLERWLRREAPYDTPELPAGAGELQGGLRLIMCERDNLTAGISISQRSFEAMESALGLHPVTLPSFDTLGGSYAVFTKKNTDSGQLSTIYLVIKFPQKNEVANYLLSLRYDVATAWTDAFICGDGVVHARRKDDWEEYGRQNQQIIETILGNPSLWDNPLFLPFVLLQNYTSRCETRRFWTGRTMTDLETELGVTQAGGARPSFASDDWPQNVEPKKLTPRLHSLQTQAFFMSGCCSWLQGCSDFLAQQVQRLQCEPTFVRLHPQFEQLSEGIAYYQTVIDSMTSAFSRYKERGELQINVLYTAINQQDSILNRQANNLSQLIAISNKKESISMSTFTFITALFLPGTFTATMFSMSMFNWQANSADSGSSKHVSNLYWIFWAVTVPLTILTMAGWFFWHRVAFAIWKASLQAQIMGLDENDLPTTEKSKRKSDRLARTSECS